MCDISVKCALPFTHIDNFHWSQDTTDFVSYFWMRLLNYQLETLSPSSGGGASVHRLRWTGAHLSWEYLFLSPSFFHTIGGTRENFADFEKNAGGLFSSLSRSSCWRKGCAGEQLPLVLCLYCQQWFANGFYFYFARVSANTDTWQKDPAQYLIQWLRSHRPLQERGQKDILQPRLSSALSPVGGDGTTATESDTRMYSLVDRYKKIFLYNSTIC